MEYDDLDFGEPITEGASGVTCRGIWKQWHGGEVAIKQISIADMSIEKEVYAHSIVSVLVLYIGIIIINTFT